MNSKKTNTNKIQQRHVALIWLSDHYFALWRHENKFHGLMLMEFSVGALFIFQAVHQVIHPASRGGAAHTAGFFGQLKHIYKKSGKNIVFFSVFTMCSVENTVIYAVFGIKSVQNSVASKKVQCRDLPKPLKTPLFTLFSSIFPCANAAGQLKHIYKKSFKNIVFFSVFTFFPSKTP